MIKIYEAHCPEPSRAGPERRVVQFGSGVLLRGLVDPILDNAGGPGCVRVVQSTGGERAAALREQRGLYTLFVRGVRDGAPISERRIVSCIAGAVSAIDDWPAVLALAEQPIDLIVSNTTESGLRLDPGDSPERPLSFPARLSALLLARFDRDASRPPVVIPCELLDDADTRLRALCVQAAENAGAPGPFVRWLSESVPFCASLVDRICTTPEDAVLHELGYTDPMAVAAEPFAMWAIQADGRLRDRLAWLTADPAATLHADLRPVRERKVRILNGAHTASVPLAMLAGHTTVLEMMRDPALSAFVRTVLEKDILPAVDAPDTRPFAAAVIDRFSNPHIRHELRDITAHHTAKIAARLLPTLDHRVRAGDEPRLLCLGLAGYLAAVRDDRVRSLLRDDLAPTLHKEIADAEPQAAADALLAMAERTSGASTGSGTSAAAGLIAAALGSIERDGVGQALRAASDR